MSNTVSSRYKSLVGVELVGGWTLGEPVEKRDDQTGGCFSVGFLAHHGDGRHGFVKLVDYEGSIGVEDPATALLEMFEAHVFERGIVELCNTKRVSRVVRAYAHGSLVAPDAPFPVPYIVFELADGDVRRALDASEGFAGAVRLRFCHSAVLAVLQLHRVDIAHQDVKPSNLLTFQVDRAGEASAKLGDLGRASERTRFAPHDHGGIAGDRRYAPPEQKYRFVAPDFETRRLGCDLYQLGSLIAFVLTGVSMNARIEAHLAPQHRWNVWTDSWEAVFPYVVDAHANAVSDFESRLREPLVEKVVPIVAGLTEPDPKRRIDTQISALSRMVTTFDLLSRRVEILDSVARS